MNYLAWVGYNFYNAATPTKRASLFSSYGLLEVAPGYVAPTITRRIADWFWEFFS
jgi:hypothetical protein